MSQKVIYVKLSKQARDRVQARLGVTLPWEAVFPSQEKGASGGIAKLTPAQYAAVQEIPGVRRIRDPFQPRTPVQPRLL